MICWIDAQLPPRLAIWLASEFGAEAVHVRDLGFRDATDRVIFEAARTAEAVVVTKDVDFVRLLEQYGPPPCVIWLTCGNTSNRALRGLLSTAFPAAKALLDEGEQLVEITGP